MILLQDNQHPKSKPISASSIEGQKIPLIDERMSPSGVIFGSRILEIVSNFASEVAQSHSEIVCQTTGIDFVRFISPAKRGDVLHLKSSINRVWGHTMEVGVKVESEGFRDLEVKHILSAYFTYQALDLEDKAVIVPRAHWETEHQKRRFFEAEKRRALRLQRVNKGIFG